MFMKMAMRPESSFPHDLTSAALGRGNKQQLYGDGCAVILPLTWSESCQTVNGTWHWAATAISQDHYLALRPGGLIQG